MRCLLQNKILCGLIILIIFISGCSKESKLIGSWKGNLPESSGSEPIEFTFTNEGKLIIESLGETQIGEYDVINDDTIAFTNSQKIDTIKYYIKENSLYLTSTDPNIKPSTIKLNKK